MARPTKEEARDTRRLILDAALELFSEEGFAGTSMRQIARAVGVRESALYHHFPSKASIFEALLGERGAGRFERLEGLELDVLLVDGTEPLLRFIAHLLIEEWATPREQKFMRLLMAEGSRLKGAGLVQSSLGVGQAHLGGLFAELIRRGAIRHGDTELYVIEFMGPLLMMRVMHLVLADGTPDLERLRVQASAHVHHFCESVKTKEPPSVKPVSRRRA